MEGDLPAWITALISISASTALTTVISLVIKRYFDRYIRRKDAEAEEQEKRNKELARLKDIQIREQRRIDVSACMDEAMKTTITPLIQKIDLLSEKMDKVEDGTLATLRNDILEHYYVCLGKGYRNDYDLQNMQHLYEAYKKLHGNSYVDDVMDRFMQLPTKEEYRRNHPSAGRLQDDDEEDR